MTVPPYGKMRNKLLAILPEPDYQQVAASLQAIDLPKGTVITNRGERVEDIYFLASGVGSVVVETPEGHQAEAGMFGWDGYVPTSAAAKVDYAQHNAMIQIAGDGYRVSYADFHDLVDTNRNFAKVIARSIEAFAVQLSYTVASNAVHDVNERLARWLLMCHDRVQADELALTHESLSLMLAVRRPSVTTAIHVLEGNRFIKAERGHLTIRNRRALEEFAHDAYGRAEEEQRRLMSDLF